MLDVLGHVDSLFVMIEYYHLQISMNVETQVSVMTTRTVSIPLDLIPVPAHLGSRKPPEIRVKVINYAVMCTKVLILKFSYNC